MPAYDYRCRTCDATFEVRRPLSAAPVLERCPQGHDDTTRVFTAVAIGGSVGATASAPAQRAGGCCGGGCCGG